MMRVDAEILNIDDLAELFACDKETAAARLTSGDLPGVKVGRGWIIPRQALFERLNEKALEEAATRREYQLATLKAAEERGKAIHTMSARVTAKPQTVPQLTTSQKPKGRKRRIPPTLPNLNSNELTNST